MDAETALENITTLLSGDKARMIHHFVVVFVVVVVLLYKTAKWFINRKRFIIAINKLPGPPMKASHSFWGHFDNIFKTLGTVPKVPTATRNIEGNRDFMDLYGQPHGIYRLWFFNPYYVPFARGIVWITDPFLAKQLLMNKYNSKHLIKYDLAYKLAKPLIGDSLLSLPTDMEWKHNRRIAAKCFGQKFMDHAYKVTNDIIKNQLCPRMEKKLHGLEMLEISCRLTAEILGEVAFGQTFGGLKKCESHDNNHEESLYDIYDSMIKIVNHRLRYKPFESIFKFAENKRFGQCSKRLDSVISKIVQDRMEQKKKQGQDSDKEFNDLLSFLLTEQEDDDENNGSNGNGNNGNGNNDSSDNTSKEDGGNNYELSYKYIFGNVRMFLYVGHETTAGSLSCGLWQIAKHTSVQDKLYQELKQFFANDNKHHQGYNDMMQLEYLDAVAREILRMFPTAPVVRSTTNDIEIFGNNNGKTTTTTTTTTTNSSCDRTSYKLPKDTTLCIFPYLIHRNPKYYEKGEDPDEFNPDRFLQNKMDSKNLFMPFSVGPRDCVGRHLAMMELKSAIAQMVYRYKLRPNKDAIDPVYFFFLTVRPNEVLIDIEPRTEK